MVVLDLRDLLEARETLEFQDHRVTQESLEPGEWWVSRVFLDLWADQELLARGDQQEDQDLQDLQDNKESLAFKERAVSRATRAQWATMEHPVAGEVKEPLERLEERESLVSQESQVFQDKGENPESQE